MSILPVESEMKEKEEQFMQVKLLEINSPFKNIFTEKTEKLCTVPLSPSSFILNIVVLKISLKFSAFLRNHQVVISVGLCNLGRFFLFPYLWLFRKMTTKQEPTKKQEKTQPNTCDWKDGVRVCGFSLHTFFSWHTIWILYNAFHLKASEMFYAVQHFHCPPVLVNKAKGPEVILAKVE